MSGPKHLEVKLEVEEPLKMNASMHVDAFVRIVQQLGLRGILDALVDSPATPTRIPKPEDLTENPEIRHGEKLRRIEYDEFLAHVEQLDFKYQLRSLVASILGEELEVVVKECTQRRGKSQQAQGSAYYQHHRSINDAVLHELMRAGWRVFRWRRGNEAHTFQCFRPGTEPEGIPSNAEEFELEDA